LNRKIGSATQLREAYFADIAAPCGGFEAHAPAEPPSFSSPARPAPPRWSLEKIGDAGRHKNYGDLLLEDHECHRSC
jgi:hypothetical protein